MNEDTIYIDEKLGDEPFRFDNSVARVFPDMLQRSIPGYAASLEAIGSLASRYVKPGTNCYDLGCSLGAASLAMRQGIRVPDCQIIAVDNSEAMVDRCKVVVANGGTGASQTPVDISLADIRDVNIENASMVVMNYTLHFLPTADRDEMVARICRGLNDGGVFVLSEKIKDEDDRIEDLLIDLHHEQKKRNAYSDTEITRKRAAIEKVLVPESLATHRARLSDAGFSNIGVWLRHFNFVSLVAFK